ncbi:hypothetical protein JMJ35_008350 [Cladonia borealis]|uniref:Uncharacterized protein n=1 Tax=Cladonia borealis TaxID=184061 RepID=A0AA39V2R1_9LECA|nr:hypothetical protein JMJ35_008350 [Cladonia borealis]
MSSNIIPHSAPTGPTPTSAPSGPQGLGRIPINYLTLTSPTPRETSLTSPRLGQPLIPGGHERSSSPESESSDESVDMDSNEDEEGEESNQLTAATQTTSDGGSAGLQPVQWSEYQPPDHDMTQPGPYVPVGPTVHWAEPLHTGVQTLGNILRENIAIRANSRANAISIPDAELVRRAENDRISQALNQEARIRPFPACCLHEGDHIRVHGRSCEITSITVNRVIVRITVDLVEDGYILEVRPSYRIAMSESPIPEEAMIFSSAAMLVARDYTFLRDRPCMLTRVTAPRLHDEVRDVRVIGVDLETGERLEATLGEDRMVPIASKPVGKFVPASLSGPGSARVTAASLKEGYYMVIEGRACKVVCVNYPERPCEAWCWRWVRVVGMDTLSSTTGSRVFRGVDLDMDSMVTVGRHGIDHGPCDALGGGNILGHMSAADDLFNNVSF